MSPSLRDFLQHILDEGTFLLRTTTGKKREEILDNEITIRAVVRSLEIIGEASKKIPSEVRSKNPFVPWSDMARMRDVLIHDYFGIDYEMVWRTVPGDIPDLSEYIKDILTKE